MEVKAKAIKNIFSEATEEQVNAISKLMEKQANEYGEEIENLREQLTAANKQIEEFQSMNIDEIKASAAAWQEKYASFIVLIILGKLLYNSLCFICAFPL